MAVRDYYHLDPADTRPRDSNSNLRINRITFVSNSLLMVWQGGTNARQILQYSSDLRAGWRDLLTNWPPMPVTNFLSDAGLAQTNSLFFRFKAARSNP